MARPQMTAKERELLENAVKAFEAWACALYYAATNLGAGEDNLRSKRATLLDKVQDVQGYDRYEEEKE